MNQAVTFSLFMLTITATTTFIGMDKKNDKKEPALSSSSSIATSVSEAKSQEEIEGETLLKEQWDIFGRDGGETAARILNDIYESRQGAQDISALEFIFQNRHKRKMLYQLRKHALARKLRSAQKLHAAENSSIQHSQHKSDQSSQK